VGEWVDIQTIFLLIAIIGCFVGLAGWISGRDNRIGTDSEWRGTVNGKLDALLGISKRVDKLEEKVEDQGKVLAVVEQSTKSAHHRINEHIGREHLHED